MPVNKCQRESCEYVVLALRTRAPWRWAKNTKEATKSRLLTVMRRTWIYIHIPSTFCLRGDKDTFSGVTVGPPVDPNP